MVNEALSRAAVLNKVVDRLSSNKVIARAGHWLPLAFVIVGVTGSFIHGWYFDQSKPQSGIGWADQDMYSGAADRLASGHLPTVPQLHFSVGYPLLGALGHLFSGSDPFMIVSLGLLLASTILCFLAADKLFGAWWALIFCLLLFYWQGAAGVFSYTSNLFMVPWNNQVFFFAMAFYFWLYTNKLKRQPSWRLLAVTGIVTGFSIMTREESMLFVVPLLTSYLYLTKSSWKRWVFAFGVTGFCYMPQVIIKAAVLGSAMTQQHQGASSYGGVLGRYLDMSFLHHNVWGVIIDSKHYLGTPLLEEPPRRPALLQAAPWLWLSSVGTLAILFIKRFTMAIKIFTVASCAIILFYLSGPNMSAWSLKHHCLRYITPGLIALNLATVVVLREVLPGLHYTVVFRRKKMPTG